MNPARRNKILLASLVILLLVVLNSFQEPIRDSFYNFSSPGQKVLFRAGQGLANLVGTLIKFKSLSEENPRLLSEIRAQAAQIALLKEREKENEVLREALGLGLHEEFKLILAEVIGKEIDRDFILIDKGSLDGIFPGMVAITQEKVLLGRVSEVLSHFSRVMLISSPESNFSAKTENHEEGGLVRGKGRLRLSLDLIPQEEKIEEGERVVTTGAAGIFPKGLWVGKISKVQKSDLTPFQQAEIIPAFDWKGLVIIFLISND